MSKTVVILGASQGIGAALVQHFAALPNTNVVALSRNLAQMQVKFTHSNIQCFALDIASDVHQQIQQLPLTGRHAIRQ